MTKIGCTVDLAADGNEAVERFRSSDYDAIFMDCQMPGMDGFEATAAIRSLEAGSPRTPIIALTANALKGDDERCRAAGMDDYIHKPVSRARLHKVLLRWVEAGVGSGRPEHVETSGEGNR